MFSPGTLNLFVPGDSVFILFKYVSHNILIAKRRWHSKKDLFISDCRIGAMLLV